MNRRGPGPVEESWSHLKEWMIVSQRRGQF